MKRTKELAAVYAFGSVAYSLIEIIWRGFTHWTMAITGGVCFVGMYLTNIRLKGQALWKKCLACASLITGVEFVVGCIVNKVCNWHVWDYSGVPFNIMGQVCPLFSMLWFFLSIPGLGLCGRLQSKLKAA